ncbi:iron complex transport system ATP-binding protein [Rhodobacter aestuarii]|uniref:Iron complex transport system ATP-binding protein n=1 Tax=Rhodobacter aestuarii TaxID=453582 RepID=A0A1N7P4L4_9RHOB|nr:ABC transporter ATP-binding protein [Rhodobacter aestuarii]PTV97577.1 iron complex transport system ATP-binding protein [Rhodobacter aestuarii]SIT05533.1 iron complex transport system ATP-binding protein [Rhodobacter aestuarii]
MTDLVLENLSVLRGKRRVLQQTNLHLHPGEFVGLIGPNGAGKSTLLRAALGLVGAEGHSSLARLSPAVRARIAAWLPQAREIAWPMPVIDLVALAQNGRRDAPQVQAALARMDVAHLAERPATALSGGEQARVLMARALAQDTPILLADEPIAGLDPAHQIACMKLFAARAAEGRVVMASLHDLGLAARFCARIVVLDHGQIVADGAPEKVLTPDLLGRVFGIHCHIATVEGGLVLHPLESCNHLTWKEGSDAG